MRSHFEVLGAGIQRIFWRGAQLNPQQQNYILGCPFFVGPNLGDGRGQRGP